MPSKLEVRHNGNKFWWDTDQPGWCHREDGPAIEIKNGNKEWFIHGKRHRTDGPAIEGRDGSFEWWQNGRPHRLDGPAVRFEDGAEYWYINGHRIPPRIITQIEDTHKIKQTDKEFLTFIMLLYPICSENYL